MTGAALTTLVRISWRRGEALASTTLLLTSFPSTGFSAMAADTAARPRPSLPPPPPSPAGRPYNGGGAEPRQRGGLAGGGSGPRGGRRQWGGRGIGCLYRPLLPAGSCRGKVFGKEVLSVLVWSGLVWFGLQKNEMLSSPDDLMGISADRMSPLWPFV